MVTKLKKQQPAQKLFDFAEEVKDEVELERAKARREKARENEINAYRKRGYTDEWIEQRLENKEVHAELINVWKELGIEKPMEFAQLTDEILFAWSGRTTRGYKEYKRLPREADLRDNMSRMELTVATMGEQKALELARDKSMQGFGNNKLFAQMGGAGAREFRREYEDAHDRSIITSMNFKEFVQLQTEHAK